MQRNNRIIVASLCFTLALISFLAIGGALAETSEDERTTALAVEAKKEAKVVWYTAGPATDAQALLKKFHERHPFIATEVYRTSSEKMLVKILGEYQAKRYAFDVYLNTGAETEILIRRGGVFAKYESPNRIFFPQGFKDSKGFWTDLYMNLNVIGYNTRLVLPREVPKSYGELLAPRWKGKMGMDTKAFTWFAGVLGVMGEKKGVEYMRKLGEQNIQFRTGRTLNAQMVVAGEIDLSITCYNNAIEEVIAKGAPVNWTAIEPVVPEIHPIAIAAHAPHPNAAKLLIDFLLSKEGQGIVASFYRIPSRSDVDPIVPTMKKGLKIMPPSFEMVDNYDKYVNLYRELLVRK